MVVLKPIQEVGIHADWVWLGQASEYDVDHGEAYKRGDGSGVALEVACQAAVATDPSESALDNPSFGQDDEAVRIIALDVLQGQVAGPGDGRGHLRPLIVGIGEGALDEGERTPRSAEQLAGTIPVLHIGGMNDDAQQEAERVDDDVSLAARDLLARINTPRVERGAPF